MRPHYYLMKNKKILRLEDFMKFEDLPVAVHETVFDKTEIVSLDQDQANWRVVIFRDEILDYDEYLQWLNDNKDTLSEDQEFQLIAN